MARAKPDSLYRELYIELTPTGQIVALNGLAERQCEGAGIILLTPDHQTLLVQGRRLHNSRHIWSFPKGHRHFDERGEMEPPLQGALRELKEETGIILENHPYTYIDTWVHSQRAIYFIFAVPEPIPTNPEDEKEVLSTKWWSLHDLTDREPIWYNLNLGARLFLKRKGWNMAGVVKPPTAEIVPTDVHRQLETMPRNHSFLVRDQRFSGHQPVDHRANRTIPIHRYFNALETLPEKYKLQLPKIPNNHAFIWYGIHLYGHQASDGGKRQLFRLYQQDDGQVTEQWLGSK